MEVIYANSPDDGLYQGITLLKRAGLSEPSRNGAVLVAPTPVTTVYLPGASVISRCPVRDANPFFHLVEAMWMLLGRNDVDLVAKYAASMRDFSDDGKTLWGAYGYRWRNHFFVDQLDNIARELKENPGSRRAVLAMWDGAMDQKVALSGGKDVPCNTQAYFWVRGHELNMTVGCRSNDIVWGAYGANVVHFGILLRYMAARLELDVGTYYQMSNNFHAYAERPDVKRLLAAPVPEPEPEARSPETWPALFGKGGHLEFLNDVDRVLSDPHAGKYESPFVCRVLVPMVSAYMLHKAGAPYGAHAMLDRASGRDSSGWCEAGAAWISRRIAATETTKDTR